MNAEDIARMCEKNLSALAKHWIAVCMDDRDYVRIVRVLIEATESFLEDAAEADAEIEQILFKLQECARDLYVAQCVRVETAMANQGDYEEECAEIFDHLCAHGEYPGD